MGLCSFSVEVIHVAITEPSHFVVKFLVDETVCVIPRKNVVSEIVPSVGDKCDVKWSDGDILTATLLAAGKTTYIAALPHNIMLNTALRIVSR